MLCEVSRSVRAGASRALVRALSGGRRESGSSGAGPSFAPFASAGALAAGAAVSSCFWGFGEEKAASTGESSRHKPSTPEEAINAVVQGNARFMQARKLEANNSLSWRMQIGSTEQKPFAVIVTCSDSRCPPEVLFDCGLGDIFVVRVAGHVVDSASLASIEYAVEHLGALAVIVVGHEKCGAISEAVKEFRARAAGAPCAAAAAAKAHSANSGDPSASHIGYLLGMLQPCVQASVDALAAKGKRLEGIDDATLVEDALRMNVSQTAKSLTDRSPMLAKRVREGRLGIAGFRYDLNSPADVNGDALSNIPIPPIGPAPHEPECGRCGHLVRDLL